MTDERAESSAVTSRVSANRNLCHGCGWSEDPAEKNYRKCPECGAEFLERYVERTFGNTSGSSD